MVGLAYAGPVILLLAAVYFRMSRTYPDLESFVASEPDLERLIAERQRLWDEKEQIDSDPANIDMRNLDGTFTARSRRGKQLRLRVVEIDDCLAQLDEQIQGLFRPWGLRTAGSMATNVAIAVYIGALAVLSFASSWYPFGLASLLGLATGAGVCWFRYQSAEGELQGFGGGEKSASREESGGASDDYDAGTEDLSDDPEPAKSCYGILEVAPTASHDQINAAFKNHMKQCHPDGFSGHELYPEFAALANEKAKQLNAAHKEALRRCRCG
jgi:hypothetical protein